MAEDEAEPAHGSKPNQWSDDTSTPDSKYQAQHLATHGPQSWDRAQPASDRNAKNCDGDLADREEKEEEKRHVYSGS